MKNQFQSITPASTLINPKIITHSPIVHANAISIHSISSFSRPCSEKSVVRKCIRGGNIDLKQAKLCPYWISSDAALSRGEARKKASFAAPSIRARRVQFVTCVRQWHSSVAPSSFAKLNNNAIEANKIITQSKTGNSREKCNRKLLSFVYQLIKKFVLFFIYMLLLLL